MRVEQARVHQRADDEDDREDENHCGSRQRLHQRPPDSVSVMTKMPAHVMLLPLPNHNVAALSHVLLASVYDDDYVDVFVFVSPPHTLFEVSSLLYLK